MYTSYLVVVLAFYLQKYCILEQGSANYDTHATVGIPSNFQWHAEALSFIYQSFGYD